NSVHGSSVVGFTAGSLSRRVGQPRIFPTFEFQVRASRRPDASPLIVPDCARQRRKRSRTTSSTSVGAMPLAEQNRMKADSLQRTNRSLIWARNSSHAGVSGAPCLGMRFSRASHTRALFALLL